MVLVYLLLHSDNQGAYLRDIGGTNIKIRLSIPARITSRAT